MNPIEDSWRDEASIFIQKSIPKEKARTTKSSKINKQELLKILQQKPIFTENTK